MSERGYYAIRVTLSATSASALGAMRGQKKETRIEHQGVVVYVTVSSGDLFGNAQNEPEAVLGIAGQLQGANHHKR